MYNIQLIPKENIDSIIPLLQLLNPKTENEVIVQRLSEIKNTNYQCVGVYDNSNLIAISGIWILNKIYAGKHIEPDNVVVHPDYRSKGIGEQLLNWIHEYGKNIGCLTSELNSRITNESGNKFWERQGYKKVGYHFIKQIIVQPNGETRNTSNSCLDEHTK